MNLQNLVDYCQEMGLPDPFSGASVPAPLNIDTVISAIMVRCGLQTPLYGEPDTFRNVTTHWFNTKQWTFEHLIAVIQSEYSPIENVFENRKETSTYGSSNIHTGGWKDAASGKDTTTHSEKDTTERSFDNYHDKTERSFDNYHDKTDRTYDSQNPLKEVSKMEGSKVSESQISAFNSSGYQPDNKTGETFGVNAAGASDPRQDTKTTTGKITDDRTETGTYKDDRTETGTYKDETTFGHKITTDNGKTITRTFQNDKEDHVGIDTFEVFRHGNIGVTTNQQMINEELELLRHFDIYGYIAELFENDNMLMIY